MTDLLRITVCQLDNRADHRADALAALARHVAGAGSDLVLLPELPFSDWLAVDTAVDPARWQRSVEEHGAAVAALDTLGAPTVIASRPTAARRNEAFAWTRHEGVTALHDKYYLPDEPGYWEATWYERGERRFDVHRLPRVTVGALLCTELWFLEWARHYGRQGAELVCVPRATPYESLEKWVVGGRVAAVCAGAFIASSNQWTPGGSGLAQGGVGWVTGPDGAVLAVTGPDEPFVTVEIDLDEARKARDTYPRYVPE
jgi:N-carbamoylputrescine amidase